MSAARVDLAGQAVPVRKILCAGRNYAAHAAEMGSVPPAAPFLFLKPLTALHTGGGEVRVPEALGLLHHEVELVALLGGGGKNLSPGEAERLIAGYAVGVDLTLREEQERAKRSGGPWALGKGFDCSAPVGAFVPAAEAGDPLDMPIRLEVNGRARHDSRTSFMLFRPGELLAYVSRFLTLEEGDLLFTGTPEGVGPLAGGDRVVARAGNLPELRFTIVRP
ncbi:MAG: fumarylacetoacetate hydrolase family protein [Candidatus Eisenbacteria bacterium]|nr:fumarylacetoacetate hydrolase family protein [Candidatus Eisenbacteria bacterium]